MMKFLKRWRGNWFNWKYFKRYEYGQIDYIIKVTGKQPKMVVNFLSARYGSKKDDTGKVIDRKSGKISGGRRKSKSVLIERHR